MQANGNNMDNTIVAGYVLCALSLFIFPIPIGLAAFVIGIVNTAKGKSGHGIAQILLSLSCALVGVVVGGAVGRTILAPLFSQ